MDSLLIGFLLAMRRAGVFAAIFSALLHEGTFAASHDADAQYRFDTWKAEQGLPQNTVRALHQSEDGYLWFGTRFGIVRFDGVDFRMFDRFNTPGLVDENCIGITEKDGQLWFAITQGVVSLKDGVFSTRAVRKGISQDRIYSLCLGRNDSLWLGAANGVIRLQGDTVTTFSAADGLGTNTVASILEDRDGTLWAGTERGLKRLHHDSDRFTDAWVPGEVNDKNIKSLFQDSTGALWAGTASTGLARHQNGLWTHYTTKNGLPGDEVDLVTEDRENNLWMAIGGKGLFRLRNDQFAPFGEAEGLARANVLSVLEDREGNLWIGTEFGGLKRMRPSRILSYSTDVGLAHRNTWSISEHKGGGVWVGTDVGYSLFEDGKFSNFSLPNKDRDPLPMVKSLVEDSKGDLWIGTEHSGLWRRHDGRWSNLTKEKDGLCSDKVDVISEDHDGKVWIGNACGLSCFKDGHVTNYVYALGSRTYEVRAICEDHSGNLWVGTYGGGIARFHDGHFETVTSQEGLSDNRAWCIYEDGDHILWIGTENGLNRLKGGKLAKFTRDEGLFDNVVNSVLDDGLGNLWISCNRGIYCVAKKDFEAVVARRTNTVSYVSYGISDGMLSSETNGEHEPAACKTHDDQLWFPTNDGIVRIDPHRIQLNEAKPPVVIEEVSIDNTQFAPQSLASLPPGHGDVVELHYTANSLVAPEKVRFKYRLVGRDRDWIDAANRRVAFYTNLQPGHYTFRVIACNNHGVWNESGAAFAFYLAPHFYQTWPFFVLSGLTILATGYGLHRGRLSVVRKIERLEKQHALERERARIAGEMHDDLGSSLTQIALLSELANRDLTFAERAGEHLRKILATTREVFRAMDEIVWAVNPRHDTLSSLVGYLGKYAQDFLRPAGVRCRLDLPTDLPPHPLTAEERHNLFLAVKEALNNVVKHARASEVWLRATLDTDRCLISIEDNGCGLQANPTRPGRNGLTNMKERLAVIGGEFRLDNRPGGGTKLELVVPLKA